MSYVLAIEPNRGQANVLRDVVAASTAARVVVVGSVGSALTAMEDGVPSLILVNALMPPNEEGDLVERLRSFPQQVAPDILITPVFSESGRKESLRRARLTFSEQLSVYLSLVEERCASVPLIPEPEPIREPAPAPEPSGVERRAATRIERVAWARVRINGTPVKMVDLSATGAQILSPAVLRLGDSVHVMLASDADIVQCDAGIVWGAFDMIEPASTPLFRAGISFKDADRPAVERLCIEQHRTGPGGPFFESKDY